MVARRRTHSLLVALLLLFLIVPFLREERVRGSAALEALFTVILLGAVHAQSGRRRTLVVGATLAVSVLLANWIAVATGSLGAFLTGRILFVLALGYLFGILLLELGRAERVTQETVSIAVSGYLVLGLLWMNVYAVLLMLDSVAIAGLPEAGRASALLYYSFVTLSTLGYGDMAPASAVARSCASLEAVAGQLYLAIVIARIVGLQVAARGSNQVV